MRYRGIMFRPKDSDAFAVCIPYVGKDGDDHLTPIHLVHGWDDTEANAKEILVAEFVISDGSTPMTLSEYLKVAGKESDYNIYIKSVVVAKAECVMEVNEILREQPSEFVGLCMEQVLTASEIGMFKEELILSEWKKMGYDKEHIGESIELAVE